MIRIELPTLISKLNDQSKLALEQAASLCIEKHHPEVMLEHYLDVLIDNPLSDVRVILKQFEVESQKVKSALNAGYVREQVLDTYPAFSPLLVEVLQEAWLLSTTELEQVQLRSGAVFLAALSRVDRYLSLPLIKLFDGINRETLKKNFDVILCDSAESTVTENIKSGVISAVTHDSAQILSKYCINITAQARDNGLDPVLCRDDELNLIVDILCRRRKNNPIVVGDAGVGKSAVIEGLAQRIAARDVPAQLQNVELYSLDLGLLQAGASVKGEFEKRLKGIIEAVKHAPQPIILFIDEAHTLIGSGNQEGGSDAANLLKPALARGELSTIAATTWKEYKKYFEKDPALTRRFQLVKLEEPSIPEAVDILRGLSGVYEQAHNVLITDDALKSAAELSARYISGRQLPDKAIDVLDTACARIAINLTAQPKRITLLNTEEQQRKLEIASLERAAYLGLSTNLQRLDMLKTQAIVANTEKSELIARWHEQKNLVDTINLLQAELLGLQDTSGTEANIKSYQTRLTELNSALRAIPFSERLIFPFVDTEQISQVIADWTGVPVEQMNSDELHKITHLTAILEQTIKGQRVAIERIHRNLLTARADLRRAGRPKGAFLLVGPSGVGKTETVTQLASQLYGGKQFLTTINMSEYQEKHTVSRLLGAPPGYVGYGEGGVLTEAIRRMPYSVVLLDEVEKAHPDVLNIFYQAFDKGELADGEGRLIDCQNIVFFLTSNLGYQTIVSYADAPEQLDDALYPELAAFFKPALLARMEIIPYMPLKLNILEEIVANKLQRLVTLFNERYGAEVVIEHAVTEEILVRATRSENGARMLEAIIEGQLLPPVSLELLNKLAKKQPVQRIVFTVVDGHFCGEVS